MNLFNTIQCLKPCCENLGAGSFTSLEKKILRSLLEHLEYADNDDSLKELFWQADFVAKEKL